MEQCFLAYHHSLGASNLESEKNEKLIRRWVEIQYLPTFLSYAERYRLVLGLWEFIYCVLGFYYCAIIWKNTNAVFSNNFSNRSNQFFSDNSWIEYLDHSYVGGVLYFFCCKCAQLPKGHFWVFLLNHLKQLLCCCDSSVCSIKLHLSFQPWPVVAVHNLWIFSRFSLLQEGFMLTD